MKNRILIVDDNLMVRESYAELLRGRGYLVEQVSNGEEALKFLSEQSVDLAIVDVMMPTMGGLELRQRMIESAPDVKTILVTGHSARVEELVQDDPDFRSGRTDILSKPVHPVKLLAEVEKRMPETN